MKRLMVVAVLTLSAAGCPPATPAPPGPPAPRPPTMTMQRGRGSASMAALRASAAAQAPVQMQLDLYQLVVPFGTVSRNEQFWKRVDEQAVDIATYDLLLKNGVRVGVAPVAEWGRFSDTMQEHPAQTKVNTLVGASAKPVELPMRKELRWQNIFYFDRRSQLQGRTFERCENLMTMTVQSAPRKADTMRVAITPMVRGQRKMLEYSATNNELGEVAYVAPERFYDLNLRVDIPPDHFLVVAPSEQATWPTSIGSSFFVTDGAAERMETVLLIVPTTVHFEPAR